MKRSSTPNQLPVYLDEGDPPSKRAVLTAALRLFVQKGMGETTIRDIAAEAGFTNPVLFKYFSGRDELAAFLFERCYRSFASTLAASLEAGRPFAQQLSEIVRIFLESMDADLDAHVFVQENLRRMWPGLSTALRRYSLVRMTNQLFERGITEGAVDAALDPTLLGTALLGTMGQFARVMYFETSKARAAVDRRADLEAVLFNMVRRRSGTRQSS